MADNKMIMAYRAPSAADAVLLVQALEAAGITTVRTGSQGTGGYGELPADVLMVEIWIPPEQAELARKTIDEVQRGGERSRPDWTCSSCGEVNEGNFESCWSCQAPQAAG